MKVSDYQELLLTDMTESAPWDNDCCSGPEKRSLNVMMEKGLVTIFEYANGPHWELTDKGRRAIEGGGE